MNQKLARFSMAVAVLAALAIPMLTPTPAAAWWARPGYGWHHGYAWRGNWHPGWGYGWRGPGVVVAGRPAFWVRPHWEGPYWVPGHWR